MVKDDARHAGGVDCAMIGLDRRMGRLAQAPLLIREQDAADRPDRVERRIEGNRSRIVGIEDGDHRSRRAELVGVGLRPCFGFSQ